LASGLREIDEKELAEHSSEASLWLPVNGAVHDCTSLLLFHPGGREVLLNAAGRDSTALFYSSHGGSSLAAAEAALKAMPVVGRLQAPTQPPSQRMMPGLPITGMSSGPGGLPMYTPRDIDLEFETPR
jgi:cytochrome b involved in lipid metabolism